MFKMVQSIVDLAAVQVVQERNGALCGNSNRVYIFLKFKSNI